jgi:hypothetical protein
MRRNLLLCFSVLAITALGAMASIASAVNLLPNALTLTTGVKFTLTGKTTLAGGVAAKFNSGIASITAETVEAELKGEDMSSLGTAKLDFIKSATLGKNCNTAGDAVGVVLVAATYHLVLEVTKKEYGLLFLVPATEILCEGLNLTVTGSQLTLITILKEAGSNDTKLYDSKGECSAAGSSKPKVSKYFTDTGEATAKLETTKPLKEEVCEETDQLNSVSTEMFELMEN